MSFRNKREGDGVGSERRISSRNRWVRFAAGACAVALFLCVVRLGMTVLPFRALEDFINRPCSSRVYDRNGLLLQVLPLEDGLRREWYSLQSLPPRIADVFIAAEDKNFYRHGGIDVAALARALWQNFSVGHPVSGASTITMQLARMVVPREAGRRVSLAVKIREAWIALRIEAKLSKDRILELYLNSVPFGFQVEGVGSAARSFFGCTPDRLSDARIHMLAVLLRRPATYNPLVHPEASYESALETGVRTGFSMERGEWLRNVSVSERYIYPMRLPHFVRYVRNCFFDAGETMPPDIILSADAELTDKIAVEINTLLDLNKEARLSQGAVFAIDNNTGEIVCWFGGNFFDENAGQIDAVTVRNQSGSTMKPFLYASALDRGFPPATVLADVPMDFGAGEVYVPLNFNNQYNGPVLMRTALASSLNIPAVYMLYRLGVDDFMAVLDTLGFESLKYERMRSGLSLALGSGEVTLFELTRAFSVFPRGGSIPVLSFTAMSASSSARTAGDVFSHDTAAVVCDMLSDKRARALGFGFAAVFDTPYPAIFKTGTSNQFQNIIALGATTGYTVGVWMGNFTGDTVIGETGSSIPARVVRAVLDALTDVAPKSASAFPEPVKYRKMPVCALSGMAPGYLCGAVTDEYVPVAQSRHRPVCSWHYQENGVARVRYPQEYQRWLSGRNDAGSLFAESDVRILSPTDGAVFVYDPIIPAQSQKLRIDCIGSGAFASLYVNGVLAGATPPPFVWYVPLVRGEMRLEVRMENPPAAASVVVTVQ